MRYSVFWDITNLDWYLVTDVSGQPIGPTFKGQAVQEPSLDSLTPEDRLISFSWEVGN